MRRSNEVSQSFSSTGSHSSETILNWLIKEMYLTERQAKLIYYGNGGTSKTDVKKTLLSLSFCFSKMTEVWCLICSALKVASVKYVGMEWRGTATYIMRGIRLF